jgi:VCBS repeat-containing protein
MLGRLFGSGTSNGDRGTPARRTRAVLLLAGGAFAAGGLLAAVAQAVAPPAFAASAALTQELRYIGDSAGSNYEFTLKNTGTSKNIGAVQIARPSNAWTISACPTGPSGWAKEVTATRCRYRSGGSTADDIKPGQTRTFVVKAKTAPGINDVTGKWDVKISMKNGFDSDDDDEVAFKNALATGSGLTSKLYTFEVTDAVVANAAQATATACPAPNRTAVVGSQVTIIVCGKNHASSPLTPTSARSTLGGSYIDTPGTFASGPIPANSTNVVLANWTLTTVNGTYGTDYKVIVSIGSTATRTSPLRTFSDYTASSRPPVANNDAYSTDEDVNLVVAAPGVLGNDTDPDSDPIHVSSNTNPAHGTVTVGSDGSFTYDPDPNYNGPDSFTYKANDGHSDSASATVSITVNAVNDAPVASNVTTSTDEDTAKAVTLTSTDPDNTTPTFSVVTGPAHGSLGTIGTPSCGSGTCTASVTYTPDLNYNGPDSFTYKTNDGTADSNTATVSITVNAVNDAPVANPDSYSTGEDTPLNVAAPGVLGNDTDVEGSPLTAVLVSGPAHAQSFTLNADGSFAYDPTANYNGPDSFSYKANDGTADSSGAVVAVTINAVNDAPTTENVTESTNEDTAKAITLTGHDVDADTLSFAIGTTPTHGSLGTIGSVTCGSGTCTASVTYTPDLNYNGVDSFTYKANDGSADSSFATVTITIAPVNDAPVANNDSSSTDEDTPLNVGAPGVLGNDTDTESSPLTAVLVTGPTHAASFTLNSDGSFDYTPTANYSGPDSFTYKANDGSADSNAATVSLTVDPVNDAPVASNVTDSTNEDTPKVVTLAASDVDGNALTFSIVTGPAHGGLGSIGTPDCLGGVCTATVTYTPAGNYNGPDSFTYKANDGTADSNTATVTLTVNAVNDAPVANDDPYSTGEDTPLSVSAPGVLGNDTDTESSPLTAILGTGPTHATSFTLNSDGSFDYTPALNYNGPDTFTYKANDGTADSALATVTITVGAANDAPSASAVSDSTNEDTPKVVTLAASDVDGDALTFSIVTGPAHGGLGSIGTPDCLGGVCTATVTYTPAGNYNGPDSFTYKANDGTVDSNTATVTLTVNAVNDAPVAVNDTGYSTLENAPLSVPAPGVLGNDTDTESSPLTAVLDAGPSHAASFLLNADGSFSYTPTTSYTGPDSFTYHANDGGLDSNVATVSITVVPPNATPTADAASPSIAEDTPTAITLTGHDADDDDLTFTIVTGPTHGTLGSIGAPNCAAANDCTASVTYSPAANYFGPDSFTYKVNDGTVDSAPATVSITVTSVNDTPTDIALSNTSVAENQPSGTAVGDLSTTDADTADTHTYTLVAGVGSSGNASFQIVDNHLQTAASLNFEGQPSYAIRVRTTDNGSPNLFFEKQFTITVTNVNEAPTDIALSNATVAENVPNGTTVGTASTTDPDAANTFTYTLVGGTGSTNNATFTFAGNALNVVAPIDFETTPSLSIRVRSTDQGGLFFEKQFTITVTNVNETPTDIALTAQAINENQPINTTVGTASTTDPDAGNTFTYTLVVGTGSTDNGSFNFNGSALRTSAILNFEVKSSYSIRVRTTDQGGLFFEKQFTITVNDINDAPVAADDFFDDAHANTDAIGNTKLSISVPGQTGPVKNGTGTTLTGDTDEDTLPSPDTLTVTIPATTTNGTILSSTSDGKFVYLPNAGFTGNDTFDYTLSDGQGGTDTGTVTIQVQNPIWYVDDSALVAGTGRSTDPYKSLSSLSGVDLDEAGETIFVYSGSQTSGIPLEASQALWGEPHGLVADGTTLVAAGGTNPTISSAGDAITLANGVDVQRVDVTGATGGGVGIKGVAVTTATVGTNTAVSGATGGAVSLTGAATGTITIASTINNAAGAGVTVNNRSGGAVTLSGNVTVSGANGTGVSLNSNTGATVDLTGTLALTTGASTGFTATGGGTITAPNANNAITTTSGTGVNVNATTIGANDLVFKSVNVNTSGAAAPVNGIIVSNTGTAGQFVVTGTGTTAGSGGLIRATSGIGVSLTSTKDVALSNVKVQDTGNHGIQGTSVNGLTLTGVEVAGAGDADNERAVDLTNTAGTFAISGGTYSDASDDLVHFQNTNQNATVNVSGSATFKDLTTAFANNAIQLVPDGTSALTASITNSTFTNLKNSSLNVGAAAAGSSGASTVTFSSNSVNGGAQGGAGVLLSGQENTTTTATLNGNTFSGAGGNGVLNMDVNDSALGLLTATNNTFTSPKGHGIVAASDEQGDIRTSITGNTITNAGGDGIELTNFGDDSASPFTSTASFIVRNNTINGHSQNPATAFVGGIGIFHFENDADTTCAAVTGNTVTGTDALAGYSDIYLQDFNGSTGKLIFEENPNTAATGDVSSAYIFAQNPGTLVANDSNNGAQYSNGTLCQVP